MAHLEEQFQPAQAAAHRERPQKLEYLCGLNAAKQARSPVTELMACDSMCQKGDEKSALALYKNVLRLQL